MFSTKNRQHFRFFDEENNAFCLSSRFLGHPRHFSHCFIVYDNTVLFENQPLFQMKKQTSPFPSVSASALDNFFRIRYHTVDFYSYIL